VHSGIQQVLGGRNLGPDFKNHAGYRNMRHLDAIGRSTYGREATLGPAKNDGKLTFDKLTDVYHSGTRHEDDQPVHLVIRDTDICNHRCVQEFGNPCQHFCPAAVYEMVEGRKGQTDPHQLRQLRALQDLRHHGPVPDHHLGAAGRGRRAEL
jgi:electron-transferring-flavoprotein dehydrogenase